MSKKTRFIEVVVGEKENASDVAGTIKGTSALPGASEVGGRSAEGGFLFECPWCGAINHTLESRDGIYVCFACGRPMRPTIA